MVDKPGEVGVRDQFPEERPQHVIVGKDEQCLLLLVVFGIIFLIYIIALLILEFIVVSVLLFGTTRLRPRVIILVQFAIQLRVHLVRQCHQLALDLFKLFFNVGVGRVKWGGFVQATEGVLGICVFFISVGLILLLLVFLFSDIRDRLEQNSEEKVKKHEVTKEHHRDEEVCWSETLLV